MTKYKMWKDMPTTTRNSYQSGEEFGTRFETSHDGEYWLGKSIGSPFYRDNYYRVKWETSMTQDDMTPFGKLDPVKQGEILVAFRNGDPTLHQWVLHTATWGNIKGIRQIFDDVVYRLKAAPRVCYVGFDKDNRPVSTAEYQFVGSVLMREVMED
jgi:hypothetical protein